MKLEFLGTRGYIEEKSRRHKYHASLMIHHARRRIMIDCGLDWKTKMWNLKPNSIFITHAHPDHAWGIRNGAPCPVYGLQTMWDSLAPHTTLDQNIMKRSTA